MLEVTADIGWMNTWLRAQAHYHSKDYASAITTFKSLDVNGLLKDNALLLVSTAYCYNYLCDDKKAISCLQRVCIFVKIRLKNKFIANFSGHSC